MEATLTAADLGILKAPFSEERIGVKVQSTSRDKRSALLVCYIGHTDVYDRIEEVDPAWGGDIVNQEWRDMADPQQKPDPRCFVRYAMTIKGVTRENVGEGYDPKGATSDAIKRTGMLFGIGRYLYDSEKVWIDYNEDNDKYRKFTFADYEAGLKRGQARVPTAKTAAKPPAKAELNAPPQVDKSGTISGPEANTLLSEIKTRKVDQLAFNRELKRRGLLRIIDLPSNAYDEIMEWIIRQGNDGPAPAPAPVSDAVERETVALEKLGIKRSAVHAYISNMATGSTPDGVAKALQQVRTSLKPDGLRKLFADVDARSGAAA